MTRPNTHKRHRALSHGAPTPPTPNLITRSAVARRAYDLYVTHGCQHGHDVSDWLQAERELTRPTAV